jgi:outer membrane lipoprotein-sorting protein
MRFSACCWLSLAVAAAAFAEEPSAPPLQLADVLDRMASSSGVEVSFRERKELALLAAPLESTGVIYYASPDRFARFTLRPGRASLVVVGDEVRMREGAEGESIDLTGNPMARIFVDNFVVLWSGDREQLERRYEVEFRSEDGQWDLRLVPRREPLAGVITAITLSGDSGAMREMLVEERDGDRATTVFESLRSDRAFTPQELERIFVNGEPLEGGSAER